MQSPCIEEFVTTAEKFCAFAEAESEVVESDLWVIRELLLRLIYHMPAMEQSLHEADRDAKRPTDEMIQRIMNRFCNLPFNHYQCVFNLFDIVSNEKPVIGSLADDFVDIYRDLAEGLDNYRNGHLGAACGDWCFSYRCHWARHALNALRAIEIYRTDNYLLPS